jgi:hypothetical protein
MRPSISMNRASRGLGYRLGLSKCFLLPSLTNTGDLGTGVGAPAVANTLERTGLNVATSREGLCAGRLPSA